MQIRLNGELREFEPELTIAELLEHMNLNIEGIAVAVNRAVIPKGNHGTTVIQEDDAVEVIHAVGGG